MHVLTIIGNRPQFVKLAAVSPLLRARHTEALIHTGQHHDRELSSVFFEQLGLPEPDHNLAIAGGSNSQQSARMIEALEPIVAETAPDVVLVYGDTNSTLAGALVAAQLKIPLAHVEAGLRSFDRAMPEEVNRVVCDALADLLLAPGPAAAENLAREGVAGDVVVTGDVMGDVVLGLPAGAAAAEFGVVLNGYFLVTAHRAANVDDPERLAKLVDLILSLELAVVFPVHPRTRARLEEFGLLAKLEDAPTITLAPPLDYATTISLAADARAVLTDSGGLQKEAVWLGTQCITLRPNTEWIETLEGGWNTVVDLDPVLAAQSLAKPPLGDAPRLYNAGNAGAAVVSALEARFAAEPGVKSA
jgi:UDP-N-acetylglucosamine 2-epimerase (non-hydrolysing)/UDP-GlcNAc3NAcA epimerase